MKSTRCVKYCVFNCMTLNCMYELHDLELYVLRVAGDGEC